MICQDESKRTVLVTRQRKYEPGVLKVGDAAGLINAGEFGFQVCGWRK